MTPQELEQYLTQFLAACRAADSQYNAAVQREYHPNACIQDILHTAELAPSTLSGYNIIQLLHDYRIQRRAAKQELEVTELFKNWAETNKAALNQLSNVLGEMRKILRRQPTDYYIYKTQAVGPQGTGIRETKDEDGNGDGDGDGDEDNSPQAAQGHAPA